MEQPPAFIVGNGPSLNDLDLSLLDGCLTFGVNRAFLKIDTTALVWQDQTLIKEHRRTIGKLPAVKIGRRTGGGRRDYQFDVLYRGYEAAEHPLRLVCGSPRPQTGCLAAMIADAVGCGPIVLLGADCQYQGDQTDFWGRNKHHHPQTLPKCVDGLRALRELYGDRILSCGSNSIFPSISLPEVLERLKPVRRSQDQWRAMLRSAIERAPRDCQLRAIS